MADFSTPLTSLTEAELEALADCAEGLARPVSAEIFAPFCSSSFASVTVMTVGDVATAVVAEDAAVAAAPVRVEIAPPMAGA